MTNKNDSMQVGPSSNNAGAVGIYFPMGKKEFAGFLRELLYSPRELSFCRFGNFDVSYIDIKQISAVLNQRIEEQNLANLCGFSASVAYEDGCIYQFSSEEDFFRHNDALGRLCVRLSVTWSYLIQFPNEEVPQRQEVTITFITNSKMSTGKSGFELRYVGLSNAKNAHIYGVIRHTHQTFGNDISALLSGQIEQRVVSGRKLFGFRFEVWDKLIFLSCVLALATAFYSFVSCSSKDRISSVGTFERYWIEGVWTGDVMLTVVFAMTAALTLFVYFEKSPNIFVPLAPSSISLSEEAREKSRESAHRFQNRRSKRVFVAALFVIMNISLNYFGSAIYDFTSPKLHAVFQLAPVSAEDGASVGQ